MFSAATSCALDTICIDSSSALSSPHPWYNCWFRCPKDKTMVVVVVVVA